MADDRRGLHLNISLSRACFVQCKGCYNHFGRMGKTVSSDAVVDFLAHCRARGFSKVTLCGGDPLARADIIPLLRNIKALGMTINLDTVGTPLLGPVPTRFFDRVEVDRVEAADLARLVDVIGIPVDGSSEDSVASFRSGRDSFLEEQLIILKTLDSADAKLCINTVVHKENIEDIPNILPLLEPFEAIIKWQLFQFSPTGPLGFRNRSSYLIADAVFDAVASEMRKNAIGSRLQDRLEFKSNANRKSSYLLIDSAGLAWIPRMSPGSDWDSEKDANDLRIIIGDISKNDDYQSIIDTALDPRRIVELS